MQGHHHSLDTCEPKTTSKVYACFASADIETNKGANIHTAASVMSFLSLPLILYLINLFWPCVVKQIY